MADEWLREDAAEATIGEIYWHWSVGRWTLNNDGCCFVVPFVDENDSKQMRMLLPPWCLLEDQWPFFWDSEEVLSGNTIDAARTILAPPQLHMC